ncbi:penicillin-binding transpeptidase domain-containing protein [Marmoricola sp. RAF53]|uniref:penicillin-binding transpeptidase domain-containing protein n=1 Tax=Marmoricola sp. RAF53 TaxID=3233059 RepID=UPI003F9AA7E4
MTSRTHRRRALPGLLCLITALALLGSGCSLLDDGPDPAPTADRLAEGLSKGDLSKVAFVSEKAEVAYAQLWKPLSSYDAKVTVEDVARDGDDATATLGWTVDVAGHPWKHTTKAALTRDGDAWHVTWKPSIVEETLTPGEELRVSRVNAERGDVLGAGDAPIVTRRPVVRFGIDKEQVVGGPEAAAASARRLAALLDVDPAGYAKEVAAAGPKAFVEAIVLRRSDVSSALLGRVAAVPGARGISDHLPLAPTRDFAAAILGTVGPATAELVKQSEGRLRAGDDTGLSGLQERYDEQLFGKPGIKVSALPADHEALTATAEPRVLFAADPVAGTPLRTTLDPALQAKAQQLLAGIGPASALVAIKPSTGAVLAAASGPGSHGQSTATTGRYAPGSTFKVVSSLALLRSGLAPTSPVTCPAAVVVDGKRFKNYSDYPAGKLGRITLRDAVANSCNTAFIGQRDQLRPGALAAAAGSLGFGIDHGVGFPAYFGQAPAPASKTEAAADLIGQGKVLASPLAMATVAASVAAGRTVVPSLVPAVEPTTEGAAPAPLTAKEAEQLRALMHAVVQDGSGSFLASLQPPQVLAKTGTAEYGTPGAGGSLPTHAWMIGARGDLAVAVFVATGQSGSRTAGPVLESFLRFAG